MRTTEILPSASTAYEMPVPEEDIRLYIQTQILAGEVQPDGFQAAVNAFRRNFRKRPNVAAGPLGRSVDLTDEEAELGHAFRATVRDYFAQLGVEPAKAGALFQDYEWKMRWLPGDFQHILSVGSGDGMELIFLRARFPDAKITALDYSMKAFGGRRTLETLNVDFVEGDISETALHLHSCGSRFDLIFSNHVIEHFFEPDLQIQRLSCLLVEGGLFSAGVPLDAYPLADLLATRSREPGSTNALDMNWLELRHPWKTNEPDLATTLRNAGLENVAMYRLMNHWNTLKCGLALSLDGCRERERRAKRIYAWTLKPVVDSLKILMGPNPPRRLARLVFALDRRLWFGRARIKIDVQPEVFVTAVRSA